MDLSQHSAFDHLFGIYDAFAVPPLRPHDHDAVVFAGRLNHPFAFVDEECHRLFNIDVLAGRACQDGVQRVPVVRRRHHHALDILVLVHLPEVAVAFGVGTFHVRKSLLQSRLIGIAHAQHFNIFKLS